VHKPQFRPIATTLIRSVFLWATLCALLIGA
jgi:two-component system cell cycle response regulator